MKFFNKKLAGMLFTTLALGGSYVSAEAKSNIEVSKETLLEKEADFRGKKLSNGSYEYLGNKNLSKTDYVYKKGSIPVLISAPHSIKQPARGKYNVDGYKSSDAFTGAMAKIIAEKTGAHVIYKSCYTGTDDNYITLENNKGSYKTPYRDKIKEIVKNNDIKLVIDLHGFSSKGTSKAIELGTNYGKNFVNEKEILNLIKESLAEHGFKQNGGSKDTNVAIDESFPAGVKNRSVTNYVATTLETPAIQVELGSDFRIPKDDDMSKFNKMVNALIDVTENVSKYKEETSNISSSTINSTNIKATFNKAKVSNVKTSVNIRKSPTTSANVIATAKLGESVDIIEKYNSSWYQIKYGTKIGYASSKYLKEYYQLGEIINVSSSAKVRKEAKENSDGLAYAKKGQKVQLVQDVNSTWYKVRYINENGQPKIGYVYKKFVKPLASYVYENGVTKK